MFWVLNLSDLTKVGTAKSWAFQIAGFSSCILNLSERFRNTQDLSFGPFLKVESRTEAVAALSFLCRS
jgi:hypothetical protein